MLALALESAKPSRFGLQATAAECTARQVGACAQLLRQPKLLLQEFGCISVSPAQDVVWCLTYMHHMDDKQAIHYGLLLHIIRPLCIAIWCVRHERSKHARGDVPVRQNSLEDIRIID